MLDTSFSISTISWYTSIAYINDMAVRLYLGELEHGQMEDQTKGVHKYFSTTLQTVKKVIIPYLFYRK